jgi:hypothetical protein
MNYLQPSFDRQGKDSTATVATAVQQGTYSKNVSLSKILVPTLWEKAFDHDSVSYAASGH